MRNNVIIKILAKLNLKISIKTQTLHDIIVLNLAAICTSLILYLISTPV